MNQSTLASIQTYLDSLPDQRRVVLSAIRSLILQHLPQGYQETLSGGMLSYVIPLARYPNTYNKQPLAYLSLAAQKNHYALYLTSVYMDPDLEQWLREQFALAGKKLDMGKSCVRFRKLEDLPLEALGELIAQVTPEQYIARYEQNRQQPKG